ncbi:hypothetical protein CGUA_03810 [Corynebacterium guangdongense]|nr:hypothetical protein CGUA_03810 [Corynebacterium guangdongense]
MIGMANVEKKKFVDPGWPENTPDGHHAVTEMISPLAGGFSPYGDELVLPLPSEHIGYVHPYTRVNR